MKVIMYTDGACRGNQFDENIGAWAFYMYVEGNKGTSKERAEVFKGVEKTTNNQMELLGVINGLLNVTSKNHIDIDVYTDSKYVYDMANGKIEEWKENGWRTKAKKPVANIELVKKLYSLLTAENRSITVHKIKGHSGDELNEYVDGLCNKALDNHIKGGNKEVAVTTLAKIDNYHSLDPKEQGELITYIYKKANTYAHLKDMKKMISYTDMVKVSNGELDETTFFNQLDLVARKLIERGGLYETGRNYTTSRECKVYYGLGIIVKHTTIYSFNTSHNNNKVSETKVQYTGLNDCNLTQKELESLFVGENVDAILNKINKVKGMLNNGK